VGSRRKAQHENAGARVAEAGYRLGPVLLVSVGASFDLADTLPVGAQPWAARAGDNALLDRLEDGEGRGGILLHFGWRTQYGFCPR